MSYSSRGSQQLPKPHSGQEARFTHSQFPACPHQSAGATRGRLPRALSLASGARLGIPWLVRASLPFLPSSPRVCVPLCVSVSAQISPFLKDPRPTLWGPP